MLWRKGGCVDLWGKCCDATTAAAAAALNPKIASIECEAVLHLLVVVGIFILLLADDDVELLELSTLREFKLKFNPFVILLVWHSVLKIFRIAQ